MYCENRLVVELLNSPSHSHLIKYLNSGVLSLFFYVCQIWRTNLGGASPLLALSVGITSLCKGVYREVESEGSKWCNLVVTNRNHIVGYYIG